MARNIVSRDIGNLKGFSTYSIFTRPPNVADTALNIQIAPDGTLQLRRGYQGQIGEIGGMGIGTFDDPAIDQIQTVCVGTDGFVYNKLTKQIYFYYDGQITGNITNVTNANPAKITSNGHGLITGTQVILRNIGGMVLLDDLTYTITVTDSNHFTIPIDTTNTGIWGTYTSGGTWSIAFADQRYLTLTIYTDPNFIYQTALQSVSCNITANRAAQINGNQTATNTITVRFGHDLAATDVVQFNNSLGILQQRNVVSVTTTSITIDGSPVNVLGGSYINQFFYIQFGKGYDTASPFSIADFIAQITAASTGIYGLQIAVNGDTTYPAAFLQILEPVIVDSNQELTLDYWYWNKVNYTISPPLPGSANPVYQNSADFENASMTAYDDVLYIANGWDYPQKYDGQTVYRAGMPIGIRVFETQNTSFASQPFSSGDTYQYATTLEQIDNRGHLVEGEISEINNYTATHTTQATNVIINTLRSTPGNNWNTNGALFDGSGTTNAYGPDVNGFYYDKAPLYAGYTLNIGDSAYYADNECAEVSGDQTGVVEIEVFSGHGVVAGDKIYFLDSSNVLRSRVVASVTSTTVTIMGEPVTVTSHTAILDYKVSLVFGDVAIINLDQTDVNIINVGTGHTIVIGDIVEFIDSNGNLQRRNVTNTASGTITVDGIPVSVTNLFLIYSINKQPGYLNFQRLNSAGIDYLDESPISNNLRINIYRTMEGEQFGVNGFLYLVASIPNSSLSSPLIYVDGIPDAELGFQFADPDEAPNPPPISKYVKSFGNQMFYAGGERGQNENSDSIFFSEGNSPEAVPTASFFFNVPNVDDDVTGIGVAGSTLVVTKNHSLWAATGNALAGNLSVVQIAPGSNIGCVAHATIAGVGSLMYFLHTNGLYAITENQLYPTDVEGNPVPLSKPIDVIFRETNFLPSTQYVLKRAVATNYTKDNQYLLFLPCEDVNTPIRTANVNSIILCYDYLHKNWFEWNNMNAAGGIFVVDDDLYFQERRNSTVDGPTANLYKQHRFYRLVDHADHAGAQNCEWLSSWEDMGQPQVRKKFSKCILLMDRISDLLQFNNPQMNFFTCINRIPNLKSTIATITTVDQTRNAGWSTSPWGYGIWSGYQDSFVTVNLKQGTVAKSMQVGFTISGINMDIRLSGFQLEIIPENRVTVVR